MKLASLHLDYLLRGHFKKFDCGSGDLNLIGSFSAKRIKQFLIWNSKIHNFRFIHDIINVIPVNELKPKDKGGQKNDE